MSSYVWATSHLGAKRFGNSIWDLIRVRIRVSGVTVWVSDRVSRVRVRRRLGICRPNDSSPKRLATVPAVQPSGDHATKFGQTVRCVAVTVCST